MKERRREELTMRKISFTRLASPPLPESNVTVHVEWITRDPSYMAEKSAATLFLPHTLSNA
jgi:hypothetical protein